MSFTALPVQDQLFETMRDGRYRIIGFGGGIRGTKTWGTLAAIVALCKLFPRSRWFYIAPAAGGFVQHVYIKPAFCPQVFNDLLCIFFGQRGIYLVLVNCFGQHLGNAIKIILYALEPEKIVFGGSVRKALPFFEKSMWEKIQTWTIL